MSKPFRDESIVRPRSNLDRIVTGLAPWLIVLAAILLVFAILEINKTNHSVNETSAYTRASNCIVAKSANPEFTQDEIERCYIQVEKDSGISLERFDEQTNGEN